MYLAGAFAEAPAGAGHRPFRISMAASRVAGAGRAYDPGLISYFADLAALYGLRHRADYFTRVRRNTFTDLVAGTLGRLDGSLGPVDIAVLAHSTPDAEPGWPACYLAEALPGDPLVMAVSDQGTVAPFSALRIIADYMALDGMRRALLVVADQTTLMSDEQPPSGAVMPTQDAVVALVLERQDQGAELSTSQFSDIGVEEAVTTVAELAREAGPAVVAVGPDLAAVAELCPTAPVRVAENGRPCTGAWDGLGTSWPDEGRLALVADYDRALRYLGLCLVEVGGRP
ncbi:hypothetical protein [Kutzneria kofuensis]|uniref:Uncharacterized protein n=1 Tax=Kutzneria kofuensis TaxID=103725 RepID=A0A7W9KPD1_9PSEU|nr:hypothetical protein [Kutzneria kofuensis]MBB5896279.1 hypothetical protein [Kutzneria kofuensis]